MDAERFDALTRLLPLSGSRRRALAAMLGVTLGLLGMENASQSAPKKCKKLKGKKKKQCLKKFKPTPCEFDFDCPDQTELCLGGECQPICLEGACPGCATCLIRYLESGVRIGTCADLPTTDPNAPCVTDADCSDETLSLCIRSDKSPCTQAQCGVCGTFAACV